MATYTIQEFKIRYQTERLTHEQAIGHCIQHLEMLYNENKTLRTHINTVRKQQEPYQAKLQQLNQTVNALQKDVNKLKITNN